MTARIVRPLARTALAASALFTAASILITFVHGTGDTGQAGAQLTDALGSIGFLPFAIIGTLIAFRSPSNRIGLLMCLIGLAMATVFFAQDYAEWTLVVDPGVLPGGTFAHWLAEWPLVIALGAVGAVLIAFPDGKLPSRRWRWIARVGTAGTVLMTIGALVTPKLTQVTDEPNPFTTPLLAQLEILFIVGFLLLLPATLVSAAAPFTRWRRATPDVREQLKWFASAAIFLAASSGGLALAGALGFNAPEAVFDLVLFVALLGIPISVGFAVMRYRLYDIDRLISRTVSYVIVTAVLGTVFAAIVLAPAAVVGAGESSPDFIVAIATLIVAALFRAIRRRVQNAVDRRFNRARYDAERTLTQFTRRLREQIDIDALGTELQSVVAETMQPAHISLWTPR